MNSQNIWRRSVCWILVTISPPSIFWEFLMLERYHQNREAVLGATDKDELDMVRAKFIVHFMIMFVWSGLVCRFPWGGGGGGGGDRGYFGTKYVKGYNRLHSKLFWRKNVSTLNLSAFILALGLLFESWNNMNYFRYIRLIKNDLKLVFIYCI